MALGMYLLTMCWSVLQHQVWWRGMTTGVLVSRSISLSRFLSDASDPAAFVLDPFADASCTHLLGLQESSRPLEQLSSCLLERETVSRASFVSTRRRSSSIELISLLFLSSS